MRRKTLSFLATRLGEKAELRLISVAQTLSHPQRRRNTKHTGFEKELLRNDQTSSQSALFRDWKMEKKQCCFDAKIDQQDTHLELCHSKVLLHSSFAVDSGLDQRPQVTFGLDFQK